MGMTEMDPAPRPPGKALLALLDIIIETVEEAGDAGVPSGPLYATLMSVLPRIDLQMYNDIMRLAVRTGRIRKQGHVFFAAFQPKGDAT